MKELKETPMFTILSPEKRRDAFVAAKERFEVDGRTEVWEFHSLWEYIADEVAKAQKKHTLQQVVEWGKGVCKEHSPYGITRLRCSECLVELFREAKK